MFHTGLALLSFVLALSQVGLASTATPEERFLRDLPAGVFLKSSHEVSKTQTASIGQKLGGGIERLTNSLVQVHGRPIQVNAVTAVDEASAIAVYEKIAKTKPYPYCVRRQRVVIEYVGQRIDDAIATKTSYELGLIEKPDQVRYRVIAKLALVEKADYMASNELSQKLIALDAGSEVSLPDIARLSEKFMFGRSLALRSSRSSLGTATYRFSPPVSKKVQNGANNAYSFENLPEREGVPYVTVDMDITVDKTGLSDQSEAPVRTLTSPTPHWPADDPQVKALARRITEGATSNEAKAMAILKWLAPQKNIRTEGPTGSRWGTKQVFEQRFGHCWDFSDCFVTLARAADVPCRQVAGWMYGSCGHVWAEFYREGKGWQQVDPTGGGAFRCGIYHIPYFTTEDGEMPILYVSMPTIEIVN